MKRTIATILVLLFALIGAKAQTGSSHELLPALNEYFNGITSLAARDPGMKEIYYQLAGYSGKKLPVYFARSFPGGQIHREGIIILDESILQRPKEIQAFLLAHEWGHVMLMHEPNLVRDGGTSWQHRPDTLNEEAGADGYAGSFLRANGYDITNLKNYLSDVAGSSGGQSSRYDHVMEGGEALVPVSRDLSNACPECDGSGWSQLVAPCGICSGTGVLTCRKCNGAGGFNVPAPSGLGEIWQQCTTCSGKKILTCWSCEGTGVKKLGKNRCTACKGTGTRKETQ